MGSQEMDQVTAMASTNMPLPPDSNSKPSIGLETLPPEIRFQIYEYVVNGRCVVIPRRQFRDQSDPGYEPSRRLGLFLTSKRVSRGAMDVFFSQISSAVQSLERPYFCHCAYSTERIMHLELSLYMDEDYAGW